LPDFPFEINLRTVQNIYYHVYRTIFTRLKNKPRRKDKQAEEWITMFRILGEKIGLRIE